MADRHPYEVCEQHRQNADTDQHVHLPVEVIDARDGRAVEREPDATTKAMPSQKVTPAMTVRLATLPGDRPRRE